MHTICEKAMTMNLSIGLWKGYRLDKSASQRVTSQAGASADAARVNKHLIPKEALAAVVKASGAIRTHFYDNTLPWRDNGDRLMTRKLYLKFIQEHEQLVKEFDAEVDKFLDSEYPRAIEQAAFRMGTMFNRDDYPHVTELRRKFYAELEIDAISTSNDFRVEIDEEHAERVRKSMEEAIERRIQTANQEAWKRLADAVSYFQERMADPKAVFRDSTVTNIAEIVDLLPGLNITDDPDLAEIGDMVASALTGIDAKEIRKDPEFREELADEAGKIMDKMSGFMKAFGAGEDA